MDFLPAIDFIYLPPIIAVAILYIALPTVTAVLACYLVILKGRLLQTNNYADALLFGSMTVAPYPNKEVWVYARSRSKRETKDSFFWRSFLARGFTLFISQAIHSKKSTEFTENSYD